MGRSVTTAAHQPRILSIDEICKRVDRHAEDWLRGKDIREDLELDASIDAHDMNETSVLIECLKRDGRRS